VTSTPTANQFYVIPAIVAGTKLCLGLQQHESMRGAVTVNKEYVQK